MHIVGSCYTDITMHGQQNIKFELWIWGDGVFYNQGCQYYELGRVWKIAIATIFIVLFLNFAGRNEESHWQPQDSLSSGRDMNPGPISIHELSVWRWRRGLRTCLDVSCCYLFSVASCPVTGADFGILVWLRTLREWWASVLGTRAKSSETTGAMYI